MLSHAIQQAADAYGCAHEMSDAQRAADLDGANPMQSAADRAATLGTIGTPAKDAGFDTGFEIGGVVG